MEKRIKWVDKIKVFACILVVIGHLLMSIRSIDNHKNITEFIIYFIYLFHMPLFFCLSGYLYYNGKKINNLNDYKKFEIKKIINLLVPYITFYSITMILNIAFSSNVNSPKGMEEWIGMINNPISPYWFIYALLSIFIIVPIFEKLFNKKEYTLLVFVVLKVYSLIFATNIYFIDSIMKNGIYFYLGSFIGESSIIKKQLLIILSLVYLALSFIIYAFVYKENILIYNILEVFMGISGTIFIIEFFKKNNRVVVLDKMKKYTFQVFLMHTIFAAGVRILMFKLNIYNWSFHFIIGLVVSIYIPILLSIISNKIKFTNFFFFPLKTIEEYKKGR